MINLFSKMKNKNNSRTKLVVIISAINILLAVLAMLKDMFMASYMGTTNKSDAFAVAFFITDMIGNNLLANAAAVSSIPVFTELHLNIKKENIYKGLMFINIIFISITSIMALFIYIFRDAIVGLQANGFSIETKLLCENLIVILLPTIMIYPLVYTGVSYLQVKGKFIVSSLVAVLFNFVFLIGIVYCFILKIPIDKGIYVVSITVLASVLAMLTLVYSNIRKERIHLKFDVKNQLNMTTDLFKLFIPYFLILFVSQLVLYYERYLASQFQAGSVAALNYAYRISQFPIWVFVAAIGTVVFPLMAKHNNKGNIEELNNTFKKAIWWIVILTIPVIVILYILKTPIVTVLFLRGAFDNNSLRITVDILSSYIFAILGQSIIAICMRLFLVRGEMKIPLIIYIFSTVINVVLDYYLTIRIGIKGIGYGAAVSSMINATIMIYMTKLNLFKYLYKNLAKLLELILANLFIVAICLLGNNFWSIFVINYNLLIKFTFVSIVVLVSAVLYIVNLKIFKLV
jgi:murein biosynthesis integral membrane protein MurJ